MEVDRPLTILGVSGAVHRGEAIAAMELFGEVRRMTSQTLNPTQ